MANQISGYLDLPELNLFLVINLGLNFTTNMVLTITSRDSVTKSWLKVDQNHKIEGPYIFYMLSLRKMVTILLYQLFVPNKKASIQFLC